MFGSHNGGVGDRPPGTGAAELYQEPQPTLVSLGFGRGLEMRKASLFALVLIPVTSALADERHPDLVTVQNTDDKSSLSGFCDPPNANGLHCRFTQMTVWKPAENEAAQRIAKDIDNLVKSQPMQATLCDNFAQTAMAFETGVASPDMDGKDEFHESWLKQTPIERADTIRLMKALVGFCTVHDRATAEAVAKASEELESRTCRITSVTFEKIFTRNYSTGNWQSTEQLGDPCGTIAYSELLRPDDPKKNYVWNYRTKNIVTNPKGIMISGDSCTSRDQSEHLFTWQTGKFYADCRYVQITP